MDKNTGGRLSPLPSAHAAGFTRAPSATLSLTQIIDNCPLVIFIHGLWIILVCIQVWSLKWIIISPISEGSGDVMVLRQSRPPPAARRPQNNSKTTGWIVLKFGIHIGSDSVLTWLTFQGRRSKVKVTASENDVIFSTFLNFHFLSHFPPKPSWRGHSNTPQQ